VERGEEKIGNTIFMAYMKRRDDVLSISVADKLKYSVDKKIATPPSRVEGAALLQSLCRQRQSTQLGRFS
jgi:hypothetical protein